MDPKQEIAAGAEESTWALAPLEEPGRAQDSATERTLEVLRARDPDDPRYETADDPRIPNERMFFKIGEVAEITGIKPYVLRYWEVEFPWIKPEKTSSRQRRYRRQDIALLFKISRLRYEEQLTIERTRQAIREARGKDGKTGARPRATKIAAPKIPTIENAPKPAQRDAEELRASQLQRALQDMRRTVLELIESVEE